MVISAATNSEPGAALAGSVIDAAELERRRLERELHDHAEQRLLELSRRLEALSTHAAPGSEQAEGLARARRELDAALRELRELVHSLHPAALSRHGLELAINAVAARSPVPVAVAVDLPQRPPPAVEIAVYYLVADALANTAEHAEASRASVEIGLLDDQLVVEVADDGRGGADPAGGTGLRGLADRIAALGGRLEVVSPPDRGTLVHARIPASSRPALAA